MMCFKSTLIVLIAAKVISSSKDGSNGSLITHRSPSSSNEWNEIHSGSPSQMTVFVTHSASESTIAVDVFSSSTVEDLSWGFAAGFGDPSLVLSMMYQGRILNIMSPLADEGVGPEAMVHAVVLNEDQKGIQRLKKIFNWTRMDIDKILSPLRQLEPKQEAYLTWFIPSGTLSIVAIYKDLCPDGVVRYREKRMEWIKSMPNKTIGDRIGPVTFWKYNGFFGHKLENDRADSS